MKTLTAIYYAAMFCLFLVMTTTDILRMILAMFAFFAGTIALSVRATLLVSEETKNMSKKVSK